MDVLVERTKEAKLHHIAVRLSDHSPSMPMRSLRAHHLGNLVSIRATVARLGPVNIMVRFIARLLDSSAMCSTSLSVLPL